MYISIDIYVYIYIDNECFCDVQLAELQHEKEITDLELIQLRQESAKKDSSVLKLEDDKEQLTSQKDLLNKDIQELKQKLQKQSEGTNSPSSSTSVCASLEILADCTMRTGFCFNEVLMKCVCRNSVSPGNEVPRKH